MTDWGTHGVDVAQWGLGMDESGPEEIWVEGRPYAPMTSTPERPGPRKGGPRNPKVFMKFAGGIILEFEGGPQFGAIFEGENGRLQVDRQRAQSTPIEIARQPLENPSVEIYRGFEYARRVGHYDNWLDCIKNGGKPVAPAEAGHRSASVCHLANIARWVSGITQETDQKLRWDAAAERFTNSDIANQFIRQPSRKGYEIPEQV
jgi:predicted dehydrogenase